MLRVTMLLIILAMVVGRCANLPDDIYLNFYLKLTGVVLVIMARTWSMPQAIVVEYTISATVDFLEDYLAVRPS